MSKSYDCYIYISGWLNYVNTIYYIRLYDIFLNKFKRWFASYQEMVDKFIIKMCFLLHIMEGGEKNPFKKILGRIERTQGILFKNYNTSYRSLKIFSAY
jgi:hypothetical protein